MLRHSDKEGLTFPGIIEDPAWTAGINISARPAIGPEAINLVSFASFIDSIAMFLRVDENVATSNLLWREKNVFFEGFKLKPESWARCLMASSLYPAGAFAPVPTAVPPSATYSKSNEDWTILSKPIFIEKTYAENSSPSVTGNASITCVLPILITSLNSFCLFSKEEINPDRATLTSSMLKSIARCIAVG